MKFRIGVKEVWEQMYEIDANSLEEAVEKLEEATLMENSFEYCYTLDPNTWTVYNCAPFTSNKGDGIAS